MAVEGWEDRKFGEIASAYTGFAFKSDDFQDHGIPIIRMSNLKEGRIDLSDAKYVSEDTLSKLDKFRLSSGDFLFGMSGSLSNYAVVSERDLPCYLNQRVGKLVPKRDVDYSFIKQLYLSDIFQKKIDLVAAGAAQKNISASQIEDFDVSVPPLTEQKKIADILESVDDTIAKTEAVIAQTQRVKQGLLQQLLTRGIGHTKFKQTDLGEIPESWGLMLGEEIFKLGGGHGPADIHFEDGGDILFLKVDDFNTPENSMGLKTSKLKFKNAAQSKRLNLYPRGTLVFPKRGAAIFKNRVQVLHADATVDPNLMCLDAFGINALFLREYMLFIGLHNFSDNSGVPQINNKHLYPLFFPIPPKAEQEKIVDTVASIDHAIQVLGATLSSLTTKKSALMSDLLTGRVRVSVDAKSSSKIGEAA